jgi:hypothetical protein
VAQETGQEPGEEATQQVLQQGLAAVDFGTSGSTVTLFDRGARSDVALSAEQRRKLGHGLAHLMDHGLDDSPAVEREWRLVVADVADHVLTDERWRTPDAVGDVASETVSSARLVERLRSESASNTSGLADHVALELEASLAPGSEELRLAADYALERIADEAFREPPLSVLRLFRVTLDPGSGKTEIPSVVYYSADTGTGTMQPPAAGPDGGLGLVPYRGLKQRLGLPGPASPRADEVPVGTLLGVALRFLVGKANEYLAAERTSYKFTAGSLQRIVITYPTMAPPVVRDTLRGLVTKLNIPRVVDRYDEAVAASMFLLMREFGGSFDPAVEAFAARSQPLARSGDRPRRWRHTMLVVDIGGGTTDIALVRLDLFDDTPDTTHASSPQRGRFYRIVPRVLGTTGESQRGGEYVTLLIFRWIKALLADHLLVTQPAEYERQMQQLRDVFRDGASYRRGSLVRDVLGGDEAAVAVALADVNLVIPTRWAAGGQDQRARDSARQLFQRMWNLADDAKKELSDGKRDYQLPRGEIAAIVAQVGRQRPSSGAVSSFLPGESSDPQPVSQAGHPDWAAGFAGLLPYETFRRLIEPVAREQVELARDLVAMLPELDKAAGMSHPSHGRADSEPDAGAARPPSRLDRVVLTGRGSRLPTVREQLIEVLSSGTAHDGNGTVPVDWDPGNLFQEVEFAKHATSIGAAWAESINDAVAPVPDEETLDAGAVLLHFDVDQLLSFMRGTFKVDAARGSGRIAMETLFRTGTPFRLEGDKLVLRSRRWLPMPPLVTILRQRRASDRGADSGVAWCGISLEDYQQRHPDQKYEGDLDALQRMLYFRVEATPELDMRILLCVGHDPCYLRSESTVDVSKHVSGWFPPAEGDPRGAGDQEDGYLQAEYLEVGEPADADEHDAGVQEPNAQDQDAWIVVNPGIPGSTMGRPYRPLFSRADIRRAALDTFITRSASENGTGAAERFRGIQRSLPPPGPDGWHFYLRDPAQPEQEMLHVAHIALFGAGTRHREHRLATRAGTPPLHTAVLDETGHLAVYPGQPPFRLAKSLAELADIPGSVLITAMPSAQPDYYSPDDPFSGLH